jgi:hypothetical protein
VENGPVPAESLKPLMSKKKSYRSCPTTVAAMFTVCPAVWVRGVKVSKCLDLIVSLALAAVIDCTFWQVTLTYRDDRLYNVPD